MEKGFFLVTNCEKIETAYTNTHIHECMHIHAFACAGSTVIHFDLQGPLLIFIFRKTSRPMLQSVTSCRCTSCLEQGNRMALRATPLLLGLTHRMAWCLPLPCLRYNFSANNKTCMVQGCRSSCWALSLACASGTLSLHVMKPVWGRDAAHLIEH